MEYHCLARDLEPEVADKESHHGAMVELERSSMIQRSHQRRFRSHLAVSDERSH